jgi:hypothetical protein
MSESVGKRGKGETETQSSATLLALSLALHPPRFKRGSGAVRLVLGELVVELGIDRTLDLAGSLHELRAGSAETYGPNPARRTRKSAYPFAYGGRWEEMLTFLKSVDAIGEEEEVDGSARAKKRKMALVRQAGRRTLPCKQRRRHQFEILILNRVRVTYQLMMIQL